ncbi:Uncharacterised protein [Citrobacter koseri]|uniref:Uncharacterized protein n=1 Tax=Citrobacter koseri TaxID=545 RepID=A0A447USG9_CITKO|nr:Uncharacterised protein [Citrobacter koseri]
MREQAVGHYFHVTAHTRDGIQQGQPIKRACRVVGNDDQRAMCGDVFEVVCGDIAAYFKVFENLFHHVHPFQMGMAGCKLLKFFFIQQPPEQIFLPGCRPRLRPQVVEYVIETKHSGSSSRPVLTVEGTNVVCMTMR